MTVTGAIFLAVFVIVAYVLLRMAVKLATYVLGLALVLTAVCYFVPSVRVMVEPEVVKYVPFLKEGAKEAMDAAGALKGMVKQ